MPAIRLRRKDRFTSYSKTFDGLRGQARQAWVASFDVLVKQTGSWWTRRARRFFGHRSEQLST
jgi:hypothetical protein